jgi:UDP-2,3-diacylglucosamine hydrolase
LDQLKKIYFASDVHLGCGALNGNHEREILFVKWLRKAQQDASMIFLLGDIFDFWFEYRKVAPQGFVRVLGTLAEICDSGIKVHFFTGNHDIWVFDYLPRETGMIIHHEPFETEISGKKFFIAHGDDLCKKDKLYQLIQRFFRNRTAQWAFAKIHPDLSFRWAHRWSKNNRLAKGIDGVGFLGHDKEDQIIFAKDYLSKKHIDYFVFGHRHLALEFLIEPESKLFMLGNWYNDIAYGEFDGKDFYLKKINN